MLEMKSQRWLVEVKGMTVLPVIRGKVVSFLSYNAPGKEREENNIKQCKRVAKIGVCCS